MEKIININMAGRIIAIEDAAYTRLKAYLESLHQYFAGKEGAEEITNDIESRIAELLDAHIRRGSTAVSQADVEEVIAGMGTVADFEAAEAGEDAPQGGRNATGSQSRSGRKFFRDMNDKIAGGVCSGLASYMNVDPALVRIVFAILALGGWGFGFILYIALWIIVPARPLDAFRGRRLFRDGEDKLLGGVCSGIAAYFGKEAWMFRLILILPLLLSIFGRSWHFFWDGSVIFGGFTGSLVLIYIVLWIVLPVAKSDYQKMEMRGEKVDLASIRDNVIADLKDRTENFRGEVHESASRLSKQASDFAKTRGRSFAQEAAQAARPIANKGGHAIATVLKVIFLIIAVFFTFILFMGLIGYSFSGLSAFVDNYVLMTPARKALGWSSIILFFAVPVLAMLTFIVRRLLKVRTGGKYFAWGYSLLWIAGWICITILAASISQDYRYRGVASQPVFLRQPTSGVLELRAPDPKIRYRSNVPFMQSDIGGWDLRPDALYSSNVRIIARLSPDSLYHLDMRQTAWGNTDAEAVNRARSINYSIANPADSVLNLASGYAITRGAGFRGQHVELIIQVPAGKRLRYDESIHQKLSDYKIYVNNRTRHHIRYREYADNDWDVEVGDDDDDMGRLRGIIAGEDYVMGNDGILRNAKDNKPVNTRDSEDYRRRYARDRREYQRDSLRTEIEKLREHRALRRDSIDGVIERLKAERSAIYESDDDDDDE
jgi:phage shock protein PspC (stress-responsive transcriptional regulator)